MSRFQRSSMPPQSKPKGGAGAGAAQPVRSGPTVIVTRGKNAEKVNVGRAGGFNASVSAGTRNAGNTVPSALSTVR